MLQDLLEAQMEFLCRGLEELSTGQESIDIINLEEDLAVCGRMRVIFVLKTPTFPK